MLKVLLTGLAGENTLKKYKRLMARKQHARQLLLLRKISIYFNSLTGKAIR